MSISVLDPISPAFTRTKRILFDPFDFIKWLKLGFCAFLATLGEGGGSGPSGGNPGGGSGGGGEGPDFQPAWQWVQENLAFILSIAAAIMVAGCLFGLLIMWLSSRGKFMFIDGVVRNRGAVAEPWREYRREANSLFWFRLAFGIGCFAVFLLIAGLCVLIALPSIQAEEFGGAAIGAIVVGVVLVILFAITAGLIGLCLEHFVVPTMYLRRATVMESWSIFRHELLAGRLGTFILYFLMQIVMGMAIGMVAFAVTCLTCCITILPYVGTVILLPLPVFVRSYTLYFLEQFGPKWRFFPDDLGTNPVVVAGEPKGPAGV